MARYLELLKVLEQKGSAALEGGDKTGGKDGGEGGDKETVADVLQVVKSIHKGDVAHLMGRFGSVAVLSRAGTEELRGVPGMGEKKVRRMRLAFTQPFVDKQRDERRRGRSRGSGAGRGAGGKGQEEEERGRGGR